MQLLQWSTRQHSTTVRRSHGGRSLRVRAARAQPVGAANPLTNPLGLNSRDFYNGRHQVTAVTDTPGGWTHLCTLATGQQAAKQRGGRKSGAGGRSSHLCARRRLRAQARRGAGRTGRPAPAQKGAPGPGGRPPGQARLLSKTRRGMGQMRERRADGRRRGPSRAGGRAAGVAWPRDKGLPRFEGRGRACARTARACAQAARASKRTFWECAGAPRPPRGGFSIIYNLNSRIEVKWRYAPEGKNRGARIRQYLAGRGCAARPRGRNGARARGRGRLIGAPRGGLHWAPKRCTCAWKKSVIQAPEAAHSCSTDGRGGGGLPGERRRHAAARPHGQAAAARATERGPRPRRPRARAAPGLRAAPRA